MQSKSAGMLLYIHESSLIFSAIDRYAVAFWKEEHSHDPHTEEHKMKNETDGSQDGPSDLFRHGGCIGKDEGIEIGLI